MRQKVSRQRTSPKHSIASKNKPNISTNQEKKLAQKPKLIADNHTADLAYIQLPNHSWRTAPEIDEERKKELANYLTKETDIKRGIYPFKGVTLSRADIEWLIAAYQNRSLHTDWEGKKNRRKGLDLRGANLCGEDLSYLPLNHLHGGLYWNNPVRIDSLDEEKIYDEAAILMSYVKLEWAELEEAILVKAQLKGSMLTGINLSGANLSGANLEGVYLDEANLEGAVLIRANLEGADLTKARLRGADLSYANLKGANLEEAQLKGAKLYDTQLDKAKLVEANLQGAELMGARLYGADLSGAQLNGANLAWAQLEEVSLGGAQLEKANLIKANLKRAYLMGTNLEGANLTDANLEGANLIRTRWRGANLKGITLSEEKLRIGPKLADASWNDVNLTVIKWPQVKIVGDEYEALQTKKNLKRRTEAYELAVRANRQLSVALRDQGLNDEASHFAYRAQELQRTLLWQQRKYMRYLFFLYLWLTSGYGYRLWRSFLTYMIVIGAFATAYYFLGPIARLPLKPLDAIVFSMTSFHGRGFSPGENVSLSNPLTICAAFEAFVGLIIEVTFIATLTQRLFGK